MIFTRPGPTYTVTPTGDPAPYVPGVSRLPLMTTWVKARKHHRCTMRAAGCVYNIKPGEHYLRTAVPPGGEPFCADGWRVLVTCNPCAYPYRATLEP